MNKPRSLVVVSLLLGAALALPALTRAQEATSQAEMLDQYLDTVRGDLIARRDASLRAILQLSDEEAKTFWPLQKTYDKERKKLGDDRRALLQEWGKVHANLTDEKARELADRVFALDTKRTALRKKYFELMADAVSTVVAVQFLQLQSQFETMGDLKLATYVPLAVR